ncbi:MAG: phosphoadenylyl-sulfate reductase [Flavobacteriales bacterium]|nr:phosphoadenylyl-sulfate reductase [Flavobacteriales bacterium]
MKPSYTIEPIKKKIEQYTKEGKKIFATSSFQTHSIPLLHMLSGIDKTIPVYYLNTGFLFPETLIFKDQLSECLGLEFVGVNPLVSKSQQKDNNGSLLFTSDPDYCCYLNKIQPLEPILGEFDVWINGIRASQNENRKQMKEEQPAPFGCIRYHPVLNWSNAMIYQYIHDNNLPAHPLEAKGYVSIGCEPCTRKFIEGDSERNSRWFGLKKTECGLHTDLAGK